MKSISRMEQLRLETHAEIGYDMTHRVMLNLKPTKTEVALGSYLDGIEYQVRKALVTLHDKGYVTWSSGFYGKHAEMQAIDGPFQLSETSKNAILECGGEVSESRFHRKRWSQVFFYPKNQSLEEIKNRWDNIADAVEDSGFVAPFSESSGSWEFRFNLVVHYMPWQALEVERLERLIRANRAPGWNSRWKSLIEELKNEMKGKYSKVYNFNELL